MVSELTHRGAHASRRVPLTQRPWWPAARRTVSALFFALVLWLIVRHARTVAWSEVGASIADYPAATLAGAALLAFMSHALYATFDLLSRRYAGHELPTRRVLATTFISYAFNLNFGALVGGLAFRIRLYTRQGLDAATISRVYGFSMLTNWLGYFALAGGVCLLQPIPVPEAWSLGSGALRVVGGVLLALALGYVGLCFFSRRRTLTLRSHELHLPSGRMALLQLAMSTANWALIGATVYLLLSPHVAYPAALAALLAAAVAGVATHVPAGLGVLEAVFIALLSPPVAQSPLLAALLVYRAVYYLLPLALAALLYLGFELKLKASSR
jgi:glycosyltransferase 2 family protein